MENEKTISQLIQELQEIREKYGEIPTFNIEFYVEGEEGEEILTI